MVGFHWRECEIISHNSRNILGKCPNQHIIGTPTVIVGTLGAEAVTPWREEVGLLDPEHRHMLAGGTLSNFLLRGSLTSGHPVFVGGFYGVMIGVAMLLPFAYNGVINGEQEITDVSRHWGFQTLIVVSMTSFLGGFSSLVSSIVRRPPTRLENKRKFIFPLPFLGLVAISVSMIFEDSDSFLQWLGWGLLILPGPLWIHLSYAPRWRILDRIDRGMEPFEGMEVTIYGTKDESGDESDSELEEVVDVA